MSKKKIRPASQQMGGVVYSILFSLVWYATLLRVILAGGFQFFLILFLLAGLLPLEMAVRQMHRALRARQTHRRALEEIPPLPGTIVSIQRAAVPVSRSRGRVSYTWQYTLQVEFWEPGASAPRQITSEPYRMPVQNYLASTEVNVYPLPDGWHFVLDGFQLKQHPRDPSPFPQVEHSSYLAPLVRVLMVVFLLYFLLQIIQAL